MIKLEFKAAFGNVIKNVVIEEAHGATGPLQLFVNNYRYGQFIKYAGKWGLYLNDEAEKELWPDDIRVLLEWVEGL